MSMAITFSAQNTKGMLPKTISTRRSVSQRGDLVFSFAHLQAVVVAELPCHSCPRLNEFWKIGEAWDQRGWQVDVQFQKFQRSLRVSFRGRPDRATAAIEVLPNPTPWTWESRRITRRDFLCIGSAPYRSSGAPSSALDDSSVASDS